MRTISSTARDSLLAQVVARRHAIHLGQIERRESVTVHRAVTLGIYDGDKTALERVVDEIIGDARELLAVGAAVGCAAAGQPRHAGQRADRRVASVAARRERAIFRLPRRQIGQALVDSRLGRRHHRHTGGLGVLGRRGTDRAGTGRRRGNPEGDDPRPKPTMCQMSRHATYPPAIGRPASSLRGTSKIVAGYGMIKLVQEFCKRLTGDQTTTRAAMCVQRFAAWDWF